MFRAAFSLSHDTIKKLLIGRQIAQDEEQEEVLFVKGLSQKKGTICSSEKGLVSQSGIGHKGVQKHVRFNSNELEE